MKANAVPARRLPAKGAPKPPAREPLTDPSNTVEGLRLSIGRLEHMSREQRSQITRLRTEVQRLEEENRRLRLRTERREPLAVLSEPDAQLLLALQMSAVDNDGMDAESLQLAMALHNSAAESLPDSMPYEEALSEQVESAGLTPAQFQRLPKVNYTSEAARNELCTICEVPFRPSELLVKLPRCRHLFHRSCLDRSLRNKKACPMCHVEAV